MRRVYLTAGPIGAGKSTFCTKVVAAYPCLSLVSRDAVLIEMFGTARLDPYTGAQHLVGLERMWEVVAKHLRPKDASMILDCWNGKPKERREMTKKLRSLGADWIEAWSFTTPMDVSVGWRVQREKAEERHPINPDYKHADLIRKMQKDAFEDDYRLFHSRSVNQVQGFNLVRDIDPTTDFDLSELCLFPSQ